jgi:Rrf2 family protein
MLDTQTAAYALVAMYEIAARHHGVKNPPSIRAQDIATKYKLPPAFLAKIMGKLVNAELLDSVRGPRGGFSLNRPMKNITLYNIFDSAGALGPMNTRCHLDKGIPRPVQAVLNHVEREAVASVKELLVGIKLADLFKSK